MTQASMCPKGEAATLSTQLRKAPHSTRDFSRCFIQAFLLAWIKAGFVISVSTLKSMLSADSQGEAEVCDLWQESAVLFVKTSSLMTGYLLEEVNSTAWD